MREGVAGVGCCCPWKVDLAWNLACGLGPGGWLRAVALQPVGHGVLSRYSVFLENPESYWLLAPSRSLLLWAGVWGRAGWPVRVWLGLQARSSELMNIQCHSLGGRRGVLSPTAGAD